MRPLIGILLVIVWLVSFSDGIASILGARKSFQIRNLARNKWIFDMFTAFGIGMSLYSIEVFVQILLAVILGPTASEMGLPYLSTSLVNRLSRTLGMWIIAITLLNGAAPKIVRRIVSRISKVTGIMEFHPTETSPKPVVSSVEKDDHI